MAVAVIVFVVVVIAGVASGRSSPSSPFPAPSATRRRLVPFNILARHGSDSGGGASKPAAMLPCCHVARCHVATLAALN